MTSKQRNTRHLVLTLAAGEGPTTMPAQLDVLVGAARAAPRITGGRLDRVVTSEAGAFRASAVYHARRNLGRVGSRGQGYDDVEEAFGLSRTYRIELADPTRAERVVAGLRSLDVVESVAVEPLATTRTSTATVRAATISGDEIAAPYDLVRSPEALGREQGDERVTVAVVDTGVSLGHAELQRKLLSGYDVVDLGLGAVGDDAVLVGDSRGRDFAPADDVGHGSHIAGVIGAQGWRVPRGVGGRCLILPIRVLAAATTAGEPDRFGVGAVTEINLGLKVAIDLGADVANLSFGTPQSALDPAAEPPHEAILRYAEQAGCVLVAATGNAGTEEGYQPAVDPRVIAVGSVGLDGRRSVFSSFGDHVALSAPGEHIVGIGRRAYRYATGTSHAAPFVAGACALLIARARRQGTRPSPAQVRDWLVRGAQHSTSPPGEVGAGVLDVAGALDRLDLDLASPTPTPRSDP